MPNEPLKRTLGVASGLPLSPAVVTPGLVFVSGQMPSDLSAGIEAQTREVLEKIRGILESAGCSLQDVVKTTVFLADVADFPRMNSVYREYFPTDPPARSTVGTPLVIAARIEIEAIAVRSGG